MEPLGGVDFRTLGGFFILARDITEKVAEFDHTLEQERRAACVRLASEIAAQVQGAACSIRRAMSEAGSAGAALSEAVSQLDTVAAATRNLAREVSGSSCAVTGVRGGGPTGKGSGEQS